MCDADTARIIKREVSDGVIAPGYEPEALEILKSKKNGNYNVIQIDPDYEPEALERKQVFGITFEQDVYKRQAFVQCGGQRLQIGL